MLTIILFLHERPLCKITIQTKQTIPIKTSIARPSITFGTNDSMR